MKLNILNYKFYEENGGSFELLIDNVSLAKQVNYEDSLIPFWIIDKSIPTFPPRKIPEKISERIVGVCSCGEYGCDCITCQVEIENDFVLFSNFKRPGYSRVIDRTFQITKENFQEIENQIVVKAEEIRKNSGNKN